MSETNATPSRTGIGFVNVVQMTQARPTIRTSVQDQGRGALADLEVVPLPDRLDVPVIGCEAAMVRAKPPGTVVHWGESLVIGGGMAVAPADGRITGVVTATLTNGRYVPAVRMDVWGADDHAADSLTQHNPTEAAFQSDVQLAADQKAFWPDLLERSGIWADRYACPDLHGQLSQIAWRPADTVVCNLLDHDSPLRLNTLLAGRGAELIVAAADRLRKLLSARQPILAIGAGWPASLRRTIEHFAAQADVRVVALPEVYPQAAAPVLLNTLVQRRLRPGRLPVEKGVLLLDGAAALAIGEGLRHARPMLRIPLAVHDQTRGQLHYLLVPLGMSVREVLKWLDIKADALVIRGGEMLRQIDLTPNAIVAGAELHLHLLPPETPPMCGPCMRCWWCAEHCVMGAEPAWLAEAAQQRDPELAQRAGADWCIECGICDCVCPSQLPLMAAIRKLKQA